MSNTKAVSLWLVSLLICALAVLVTVSAYAQTRSTWSAGILSAVMVDAAVRLMSWMVCDPTMPRSLMDVS